MTENNEANTNSPETDKTSEDSKTPESTTETKKEKRTAPAIVRLNRGQVLAGISTAQLKNKLPEFRSGDTVRVHSKIVEGSKERVQIFEGVVIRRHKGTQANATFTVRKISYNVGVERTFLLHSPRIEKIEVISKGEVRRARLFYIRDLRGKAARIRSQLITAQGLGELSGDEITNDTASTEDSAVESSTKKKIKKASESAAAEAHA